MRGGHHWIGRYEGPIPHGGLRPSHPWRQDRRHNYPRRSNDYHPYHSGSYWNQKQEQYNPSKYYHGGRGDTLDASASNSVYTNYDKGERSILEPEQLVGVLAKRPTFHATLISLFQYHFFAPESVRQVVAAFPCIFHMNWDGVQLQPQIRLCRAHLSARGCTNGPSCRELHVCSTYISSWCSESPCPYGHSLHTEHNKAVFKMFSLEHLQVTYLKRLLRYLIPAVTPSSGCLDVCRDYNNGQCDKTDCQALHLCLRFVVGRAKCDQPKCDLNHNPFNDPTCCLLLTIHGISVNETIMDIIMTLLSANPNLVTAGATKPLLLSQSLIGSRAIVNDSNPRTQKSFFDRAKQVFGVNGNPLKKVDSSVSHTRESRGSMDMDTSDTRSVKSKGSGQGSGNKAVHRQDRRHPSNSTSPSSGAQGGRQTVWNYHHTGNVNITEICRFSVEGICLKEDKGCMRLHASQPFHWQVCQLKGQDSWFNLPGALVTCLELAFCNPAKNGVKLPALNPGQLQRLKEVLDQDTWYANFEAMVLTNSDYSKVVALRRLCVQAGAAPKHAKACTFSWFFCDVKGSWVKYGQADTTGQASQKSNITSANIEAHYLLRPDVPLSFKVSQFTYLINFGSMIQTNQTTKVQRAVRRRPDLHPSLLLAGTQKHQVQKQPAV